MWERLNKVLKVRLMIEYTLEEAKKVWLISDAHFDHTNIIKYCDGFEDVGALLVLSLFL